MSANRKWDKSVVSSRELNPVCPSRVNQRIITLHVINHANFYDRLWILIRGCSRKGKFRSVSPIASSINFSQNRNRFPIIGLWESPGAILKGCVCAVAGLAVAGYKRRELGARGGKGRGMREIPPFSVSVSPWPFGVVVSRGIPR